MHTEIPAPQLSKRLGFQGQLWQALAAPQPMDLIPGAVFDSAQMMAWLSQEHLSCLFQSRNKICWASWRQLPLSFCWACSICDHSSSGWKALSHPMHGTYRPTLSQGDTWVSQSLGPLKITLLLPEQFAGGKWSWQTSKTGGVPCAMAE